MSSIRDQSIGPIRVGSMTIYNFASKRSEVVANENANMRTDSSSRLTAMRIAQSTYDGCTYCTYVMLVKEKIQ